jgi:thiamine biosynthesis lipoprotein
VTTATLQPEAQLSFQCFGGTAAVLVMGDGAEARAEETRQRLGRWHHRFTRFDAASELSQVNAARSAHVRVTPIFARFVLEALTAAKTTGGLVDPTLVGELERAGYASDLGPPITLEESLSLAPPRAPARPSPRAGWRRISIDVRRRIVTRPAGVRLDSGGMAKGLFADLAGSTLAGSASYAVDCCGDLRLGGGDRLMRVVRVDDPFRRGVLHEFELASGGVATSGIGRRSWIDARGRPAHHLLDPATGRPAFTGVVQATALAPTAVRAEMLAKAALLSGPDAGRRWLGHGGVLVFDDGSHEVVEPAR